MPHTPASVERELRELIKSPLKTRLVVSNLKDDDAQVVLDGKPCIIVVDPIGFDLEKILHELLHIRFDKEMKIWSREFDEAQTDAQAEVVVRYINNNQKRLNWWRNAILKRLP